MITTSRKTILLSGCGGGYDIYGGLPLYHELKEQYTIVISNLSHTNPDILKELESVSDEHVKQITKNCFRISPGNYADTVDYFPEYLLANKLNCSIYAMCQYETVNDIINFYDKLFKIHDISDVYLIDGGCDVFLSGLETELATFVEDMMHLKALIQIRDLQHLYVCGIGLNVDCGHGVVEKELVARLEYMENNNIMLKKDVLDLNDAKTKFYYDTFLACAPHHSIVHSFVCCALENKFGYTVPRYNGRCRVKFNDSVLVSDLTKTFIICDGFLLAKSIVYLDKITNDMEADIVDKITDDLVV